jgi:hypothetical protein
MWLFRKRGQSRVQEDEEETWFLAYFEHIIREFKVY